jgi:glutamate racemase
VNWKISRNESTNKTNLIIKLKSGSEFAESEVAFNIRYGESLELIQKQFSASKEQLEGSGTLDEYLNKLEILELCNSLRFALESVAVNLFTTKENISIEDYLQVKVARGSYPSSHSIPIMELSEIENFILQNNLKRFKSIKVKVNANNAVEFVQEVQKHISCPIRIDGNECFSNADDVLVFLDKIDAKSVEFLEQPIPSSDRNECIKLKNICKTKIIADESITNDFEAEYLARAFSGVNLKLMKSGGLIRLRDQILKAKAYNLEVMVGCMIESTIAISYGLLFAEEADYLDLDGFLFIKNESYSKVVEQNGLLTKVD